jgi:DNA-binding PadR family transcriptional regulator
MESDLAGFGRFSDAATLIMVSLAAGPKHGYAIMEDVAGLCGIRLGPGTLYAALARLEHAGLIEPLPSEERRRPYRLTARGASVLRERLQDLGEVARTGLQRLALP